MSDRGLSYRLGGKILPKVLNTPLQEPHPQLRYPTPST
jgi:hypothetical protein